MTGAAGGRAVGRARWRLPQPTLVWAIGLAWAVAVAAQATGRGQLLHHDALAHSGLAVWAALGLFLVAWQMMIAAMMLPSSLPLIRLFSLVSANQPRPWQAKAAFLGGYVAVWTGFGAAAFVADLGIHRLGHRWVWLAARPWVLGGAVLVLAGGFQFSGLKEACLRVCRSPGGYLRQHYRRGTRAAFRLGAGHGVFCVGCCWALMLVGFAAGVASLWWMAALTAVMVFEKTGPGGRRAVRPIGVALIALGLLMLAPVATAAPPERTSTLRPWGRGPAAGPATAEAATPKGATRLVVIGQEADFTIIDTAPTGDSPGDQILFTDTLHDQAGRRIGRDQARCTDLPAHRRVPLRLRPPPLAGPSSVTMGG